MNALDIERLFKEGVNAVRAGDKQLARAKLEAVILRDEFHEQAWLWLRATTDDREEQITCLQNVLTINPESSAARKGLRKLDVDPETVTPPRQRPDDPAPPMEPSLPPLTHTAPTAVDDDLHAMITGTPRPKGEKLDLAPEDSWRAPLFDEEYVSEASIVGAKELEIPDLTLTDLLNVWVDLLLLHPHGGLQDEVDYGGVWHIAANVGIASIINVFVVIITLVMLLALPARGFRPPLITSTIEWLSQTPDATAILKEDPTINATHLLLETLGLTNSNDVSQETSTGFASFSVEVQDANFSTSPSTMFLLYIITVIPTIFVGLFYYAFFTNISANMFGGKGSFAQTLHVLSLALVVVQLTQVPAAIVVPLLPLGFAIMAGLLLLVYQLVIVGTAYGKIHRLDLRSAIGLLMMGLVFGNFASGIVCGLLSFLASNIV